MDVDLDEIEGLEEGLTEDGVVDRILDVGLDDDDDDDSLDDDDDGDDDSLAFIKAEEIDGEDILSIA